MITRGIVLCAALLLAMRSTAGEQTRISAFEYDPVSGQITKEIIEPVRLQGEQDFNIKETYYQFCVATVYGYDPHGNRTSATTRNCNGSTSNEAPLPAPTDDATFSSRTSTSVFEAGTTVIGGSNYAWSKGQFPTSSANALGHTETRQFDPRFGGVTSLTGPNLITTNWSYDTFGRKSSETRADTTSSTWSYTFCGACPANGVYYVTVTSTGAPTSSVYFDILNRELRTETQGFDGRLIRKDTLYDSLDRVASVSRPYYFDTNPVWTSFTSDALGRVKQVDGPNVSGASARTITDYNGLQTTVTISNAGTTAKMPAQVTQVTVTTKNSQGQVIQVNRQ